MNTGFKRLEQSLIDVIKESQIKLGYDYRGIQLFYPLTSLNHAFETSYNEEKMLSYLSSFKEYTKDRLGEVEISAKEERFSFAISADGVKYVHDTVEDSPFLVKLVQTSVSFGCTIDDIKQLFYKYSDKVVCREMDNGEFDCLIYFEDGKPDDYLYCLHDEGERVIYHRFKRYDYEDFGF